jgi:uncharacterized membrane protein YkvA (DUF1232 family)
MAEHQRDSDEVLFGEYDDELEAPRHAEISAPRLRRRARGGDVRDREKVKQLIRDIPNFLKLFYRLVKDPRVPALDKALVAAAIGYVLMPMDLIPDFLPFIGQVDDLYLMALVLDRLLNSAGTEVVLDHWDGEVSSLEMAIAGLDKIGSYLPERVRNLLHKQAR